jgi:hypothetical protein
VDLSPQLPPIFSHWSEASPASENEFSFGAEGEDSQAASIWRMDLPADPYLANSRLDQTERQIVASQAALSQAAARIDDLAERLAPGDVPQTSFSLGQIEAAGDRALPPPERELLRWMEGLQPGQVSFGLGLPSLADLKATRQHFQEITRKLARFAAHLAWVETQLGGRLLARTVVSYSGDTRTAWGSVTLPAEYALHSKSLKLALDSRITLLRTFTVAIQGASKLALLVATPGGALLALPAAWKFIENILAQVDQYQTIKQESME